MIPFGKTLREAREAKGYTIAQVAEMTRMLSSMVKDLEDENFSKLAAPIYGRGFIKLYCEAVGIANPQPLIAEFMDLYNGNRDPVIRERPVASEPPPASPFVAPTEAEPTGEAEPSAEPKQTVEPEPANETEPPQAQESEPPAEFELMGEPIKASAEPIASEPPPRSLSRYSSPISSRYDESRQGIIPSALTKFDRSLAATVGRFALIAVVSAALLWGIVAGIRYLYRTTAPETPNAPATAEEAVRNQQAVTPTVTPKPAAQPAPTERKTQEIPPLYLD